jgi:hypothetical protein
MWQIFALVFHRFDGHEVCLNRLTKDQRKAHSQEFKLESNARDLAGLASLLGHSSLNTTHLYIQPTAGDLAHRVESLDLNAHE